MTKKLPWTKRINVRMPEALYVDLQTWARFHDRTLNDEIVQMLMRPTGKAMYDAMLGLVERAGRDLSDEQIVREIDWIHI